MVKYQNQGSKCTNHGFDGYDFSITPLRMRFRWEKAGRKNIDSLVCCEEKVSSLSLQQLAELWVGWECDVFVFLNTKILCLFLSHSSVLQLLFVHCRLTESKDVGAKEESAQVRLCQEEATLQKYVIPFCSLNLLFHKCWWVWCVSLLVSVLWSRGETALHKAACQRHRAICQLLVDAGASLRKTDSKVTQPSQRVTKHFSQARLISIRPRCVHDWGFPVSARNSSFYTFLLRKLYWFKQVQGTSVQSPVWVIFTIVRAWPQTIRYVGCEWSISVAQQHPSLVWSKERSVGRDHLREPWFLTAQCLGGLIVVADLLCEDG